MTFYTPGSVCILFLPVPRLPHHTVAVPGSLFVTPPRLLPRYAYVVAYHGYTTRYHTLVWFVYRLVTRLRGCSRTVLVAFTTVCRPFTRTFCGYRTLRLRFYCVHTCVCHTAFGSRTLHCARFVAVALLPRLRSLPLPCTVRAHTRGSAFPARGTVTVTYYLYTALLRITPLYLSRFSSTFGYHHGYTIPRAYTCGYAVTPHV